MLKSLHELALKPQPDRTAPSRGRVNEEIVMKIWQRIALGAALTATVGGLTTAGAMANGKPSASRPDGLAAAAASHWNESAKVAANKRVVEGFMEDVLNQHNGSHATRYLTKDMQWHGGTVGTVAGRDNVAGLMTTVVTAIPDLHTEVKDIFGRGDEVVVRLVVTGTQKGPLLGIPASGRKVQWDAIDLYKLRNGKISEEWASEDFTAFLNDTGTYKAPWIQ
ncbi:ester cyclase [Streptomyces sp. NBC_00620]|uniref:ester cyclase n=1 Tax=Streptomyces sp. NBC_00620 TaxID=2903666 RepID=UPI00224CE8AC|nr:ester cyclase [Streptomyces sp. NBC_00620]MCX4974920.1 ester cyclase [Streptomyces sp. NBC_00620]